METKYYYLYETINLSKSKKYIGQHCTRDLNDGYFGSCKELKADITNGDLYEVHIIAYYKNIYDLGNAEYKLIKERKAVKDKDYYNKRNPKYFNVSFEYGRSAETKRKISNTQTGKTHSEEHKKNNSEAQKGKKGYWLGKPRSEETKRKIGAIHKGKIVSEETKEKMRIAKKRRLLLENI